MRKVSLALCLVLFGTAAWAGVVDTADASKHVGETASVQGVVSGVHTSRSGNTFINLGGRYPNQAFSGVILRTDAAVVGNVSALNGKTVGITGLIRFYDGKPEIIISSRLQSAVR